MFTQKSVARHLRDQAYIRWFEKGVESRQKFSYTEVKPWQISPATVKQLWIKMSLPCHSEAGDFELPNGQCAWHGFHCTSPLP